MVLLLYCWLIGVPPGITPTLSLSALFLVTLAVLFVA